VKQFDIDDFVYFQQKPNDTLDTTSSRTILRIKAIKPSSVLELQGVDERPIRVHSKNSAPCHLLNLDPTIITSTWIPPLDYPCQVCQRINNVDQIFFCDNYNGGYYLFCLKPEPTQVPTDIWYCSSCFLAAPWFLLRPCHTFPSKGLGGGYMRISSQLSLVHCIYMCVHLFLVD